MTVSVTYKTTSKPAMGSKHASKSCSTLIETARRRRQLVLKPIKRDFARPPRRGSQRREHVQLASPECRHDDPKLKPSAPSSRSKSCGRYANSGFANVAGCVAANILLAHGMPPQLQRPSLQEIRPEAITQAGHDPELTLKGLEIVRRELIRNGEQLFCAIANTVAEPFTATQSSELPGFITIRVPTTVRPEFMPSHTLIVHSCDPEVKLRKVIVVPIHAPILAAHCSRVPPLPKPAPPSASFDPIQSYSHGHERVVPLVPFSIPSPNTFPLMTQFLCTQNAAQLFKALVPITPPSGKWSDDPILLAEHLATAFSGASLISNAMRVYGVWQNACSLGVLNPLVWQVIDVAWKGYRDALLLARQ